MAKAFSVFVNIGGSVAPSLGAAIRATESAVAGMGRRITAVNARTTATINNLGKGVASVGKRMQNAGAGLSAGVTTPLGLLATSAGRTVFEFEKAGNAVRAVTEMTREQRTEIENLARAQRLFGPGESMKSALELAKTGFNFEQIKGTLEGALKLARAGDVSAESATDIVTNVLTSMRLPMESAAQAASSMKRVGDVFTYTANKTNTDVEKLGETFKFASSLWATSGNDLESLAAAAGAMANAGIRGSEAGVALRSAIVRMVRPTKPAIAAMDRLGLSMSSFVTQSRTIDGAAIVKSLQSSGINADGARAAIDKILADPTAKFDVSKTVAGITDAIVGAGNGSAMDRDLLAEKITDALIGAADKVDFVGFLRALKEKGASVGDLSAIFQTQHGGRMQTLLAGELVTLIDDLKKNAPGYFDRAFEMRMEGLVGSVYRLGSAWQNLFVTLGKTGVIDSVAAAFEGVSDTLTKLGKASPALLKFGTYATIASAALGPFLLVAGTAARILGPMATGLGLLAAAATTGLAARLVGVAGGVRALAVAAVLGAAGRLRAMAAGLIALSAVGGSRAVLAAIGGSILSFGRAVLMFPLTVLRGVASVLLGIGTLTGAAIIAITAALVGLGVWVYNNWQGITSFFSGFAEGFSSAFGSKPKAWVDAIGSSLQTVWKFVSDLLGPINATNEAWKGWGATVGGVVASGVNAVAEGISRVVGLFAAAYDKAVALKNAIGGLMGGGGGDTSKAAAAGARVGSIISGARAAGGPVSVGRTYLVGERGPELFTPGRSGGITANDNLRALSSPEAVAAVGGGGRRDDRSVTYAPTFNINGAQDAGAIQRQIDRYMRRMESEQSSLLSD